VTELPQGAELAPPRAAATGAHPRADPAPGAVAADALTAGCDRGDRLRGAVRGATPLALAGLVANVANLAVTLVIARAMTTRSYGAVAQLFALFFVVSMPGSALLVGVVRRVTLWQRTGRTDAIGAWIGRVRRAGMTLVAGIALVALAGRGLIARELSLPGAGGVTETVTAGAAWCLLCVDRGLLQCARLYSGLAVNLLVDAAVKSATTIVLVLAGLNEAGAAIAVLIGILAALAHARWTLYRHEAGAALARPTAVTAPAAPLPGAGHPAAATATTRRSGVSGEPRRLHVEVGTALAALAFLALLQNIDVLLQGRLAPEESGQYAAVSVTSKVLVFGAVVLAGFLLPEAADRLHLGQHALHHLGATLAILAVPAVGLLAAAVAAPGTLLSLAFGSRFTHASGALLPLAGAMTCLGATVLFTHYLLALGERVVLLALGATTAAAVPAMVWAGGSPLATARVDLAFQATLAVLTGLLVRCAVRRTAAWSEPRNTTGATNRGNA
jgi:hypothetical protein